MKKMLRILNQILLDSSNLPTTKCQNGFLAVNSYAVKISLWNLFECFWSEMFPL